MAALLEQDPMVEPSADFQRGDIVYIRGNRRRWVAIVERADVMTPFPHYICQKEDGSQLQISKLELSANPIDPH